MLQPGIYSSGSKREASSSDGSAFEAAKWFCTVSGWASVPGAYLPTPGVMPPQLPFPQFPPIVQDLGFGQQGYPRYPVPQIDFRGQWGRPVLPSPSHQSFLLLFCWVVRRSKASRSWAACQALPNPNLDSSSRLSIGVQVFLPHPLLQRPVWVGFRRGSIRGADEARKLGKLQPRKGAPEFIQKNEFNLKKAIGLFLPIVWKTIIEQLLHVYQEVYTE